MTPEKTFSDNYQKLIDDLRKHRDNPYETREIIIKLNDLVIKNQPKESDGSYQWTKQSGDILKGFTHYFEAVTAKRLDKKKIDQAFEAIESVPAPINHFEI